MRAPEAVMPSMMLAVAVLAVLLVLGILSETFEVMLLPRRVSRRVRMVRIFFVLRGGSGRAWES
jgi:hypothetical protein